MRRFILSITLCMMSVAALAQEVPQFNSDDYEGWTYNNPNVTLNASNIASGKIVLYKDKNGKALTLISPDFSCHGMDSITAQINWFTRYFNDPEFILSRTALTLAIDDAQGTPLDSVTRTPTTAGVSSHMLDFAIAVPNEVDSIRLRLVSWQGTVVSSGAVRNALFQASMATQEQPWGDVNGDGTVNVADVTLLIQKVLNGVEDGETALCDINHDGTVNVADVTRLITLVLSGE
jgi:hypothetical protein